MPTSPTPSNQRTPVRNNYAAPHTPIASAKRPRASMDKSMMSPGAQKGTIGLPNTPLILEDHEEENDAIEEEEEIPQTPATVKGSMALDRSQMSPMHPPRPLVIKEEDKPQNLPLSEDEDDESGSWVGRQVGTLFSPMLNLLGTKEGEENEQENGAEVPEEEQDPSKPVAVASDSTSHTTSQTTSTSHGEVEDDDGGVEGNSEEASLEEEDELVVEDDGSSQGSLEEDEFNPYVFIKSLPDYEMVAPLRPPIALPPKEKNSPPISLVLDLDETLVHCTVEPVEDADLVFPVVFHGMTYQVHVRLRPFLFEFLEKIRGKYEVIVFTASQKVYADELLNLIDPEGKYIQYRMFRDSCLPVEGNFLKDLNVLGRDLSKSVLVDNSPHAFGYQVDNGIPIESWFDDPNDTELLKLERFLRTLHGAKDVRTNLRKTFKTHQLVAEA